MGRAKVRRLGQGELWGLWPSHPVWGFGYSAAALLLPYIGNITMALHQHPQSLDTGLVLLHVRATGTLPSSVLYPDRDAGVCTTGWGKGPRSGLLPTPSFSPAHGWVSPQVMH